MIRDFEAMHGSVLRILRGFVENLPCEKCQCIHYCKTEQLIFQRVHAHKVPWRTVAGHPVRGQHSYIDVQIAVRMQLHLSPVQSYSPPNLQATRRFEGLR